MTPVFKFSANLLLSAIVLTACGPEALSQGASPPLVLEQTIALDQVSGRIDHMTVDVKRQKLFVAELENGSVEAVDLASGRSSGRINGLKEPQGLAYLPARDELVVAGGDGVVRFYHAENLSPAGELKLGDDADNVRVDPTSGSIVIGYGGGALAFIDAATRVVTNTISLAAHPESFRIDDAHRRVFVNLPGAGQIAVVDLGTMKVTAKRGAAHAANYPMLYDPASNAVAVVYRLPARLVIGDADDGKTRQDVDVCGDSDDLFLDPKRQSIYVSCGSGNIDVLAASPDGYRRSARIKTRSGARTSLFVPELDRLYVAARAGSGKPAAILVFRPG
jgi:DNA-binding beta-propeller fold protein YncE